MLNVNYAAAVGKEIVQRWFSDQPMPAPLEYASTYGERVAEWARDWAHGKILAHLIISTVSWELINKYLGELRLALERNDLTHAQKILIYLYKWQECRPIEDIVMNVLTQDGMAEKLGIDRAIIAQNLKLLDERGMITYRLAHPVPDGRRKLAYTLTSKGCRAAETLLDKISEVKGE